MPPNQPQSPNSQYDFIFKGDQKPKSGFNMPAMNLPKPVAITLTVLVGLVIIVVVSSLLFGGGGNKYQDLIYLMNREQEIIRVSGVAKPQLKDPATKNLAATTQASLTSDQTQLSSYLAARKTKVDTAKLTADLNKSTDTQLQTAAQNNTIDSAYRDYLKSSLATYRGQLSTAYKSAPASAKAIISNAYQSTGVILSEEPLSN